MPEINMEFEERC